MSNYQNNDDKRQILIIRQSQMERAIEYYNLIGVKPTPKVLVRTAELFKDFVLDGASEDVMKRISSLDEYIGKMDKTEVKQPKGPLPQPKRY